LKKYVIPGKKTCIMAITNDWKKGHAAVNENVGDEF